MGIFDIFKGKEAKLVVTGIPYKINTFFVPVRLRAYKKDSVDIHIKIKNLQEEALLTSAIIEVPKSLGVDETGISKMKENRIGFLGPGEEKEIIFSIWSNVSTEPGEYNCSISVYCHYRTYSYVQNSFKVRDILRVVE